MYTRQARSNAVVRPQTVEVSVTFTPEELERLDAAVRQSGSDLSGFVQNAALEAAQLKSPSKSGQGGSVDASWLTDAFQEAPENSSEAKENAIAEKAKTMTAKAAVTGESENSVAESEKPTTTTTPNSTSAASPKQGVAGEQSSLARGSGPVWEIRQALGRERLHGLGWTREHLAFVLKLSVVGVRKLEHTGAAPVKSKVAREKLLELAKAIKEPNEIVKRFIKDAG